MWFQKLVGFEEKTPAQVRQNLYLAGEKLISKVNQQSYTCGKLSTPSLAQLRQQVAQLPPSANAKKASITELVANVQTLHTQVQHAGALFQAASQFNLLEMVNPNVTPDDGITNYIYDKTQGPACAIAAGAGTIYRNYFAPVNGQIGQSKNHQIDCLQKVGALLGNTNNVLWEMKNGYALPSLAGLQQINNTIKNYDVAQKDALRAALQIGVQWHTQVTLAGHQHLVSQAYCSALPVAYSQHPAYLWESFAQLVLEATYEATLLAAIINYTQTQNNKVFLTLVGGGVFGNDPKWIFSAIKRAFKLVQHYPLELILVSYGHSNSGVQRLVKELT